jgi:hypothetical protein
MAAVGILLAAVVFWQKIDRKERRTRRVIASLGAIGTLIFLLGSFTSAPFEQAFRSGLSPDPFSLWLIPLAAWWLLPVSLVAGVRISLPDWRNGETGLLRERWFEFAVIGLSVVMGLAAMARK